MQKVDLKKVLEMLINEEQDNAENLLHQWFVEKTKVIHESLMQEDDILEPDDLTRRLEDDQDQIKAEEYYGEADDEEVDDDPEVDSMAADGAGDFGDDAGGMDSEIGGDVDGGDVDGGMPDDGDPTAGGEFGDEGEMPTDVEGLKDGFDDLESDLLRLKTAFEKIVGGEDPEMDPSIDGGDVDGMADPDMGDPTGGDPTMDGGHEDEDGVPPEMGGEEEDDEKPFEEHDFSDLGESFELEAVSPAKMTSPEYSAAGGKAPSGNNDSLIKGNNKANDRVGGKPVKFGGEEKGNISTQNVPKVVNAPLRKNQVKSGNGYDEKVSATGPKGALLNTKQAGDVATKNFFNGGVKESVRNKRR